MWGFVNGFPTTSRTAEATMNSAPVTKLEKSSFVAIVGFYISLKYEASATKNCFNTIVERWEKSRGRKWANYSWNWAWGRGGILLDLEKKLYFFNILLEYVNMSFIDFSNRSLIYLMFFYVVLPQIKYPYWVDGLLNKYSRTAF